ncbi:MAG: CpsD/CapB family tyrosine-protein kinase [Candidatus Eremiobacteraeota bacterium]|nr:CpsD/CapB family tyrosine-protein kinase [Candidatus Eremiobacteraeota bacterium]
MSGLITPRTAWQIRQAQCAAGEYPECDSQQSLQNSRLIFAVDEFGFAADQYRAIGKRLEVKCTGRRLLITSPGAQEGKSTSASNLAWALSERGRSTLLLELDLRKPVFSRIFGVSPAQAGIDMVLSGDAEPREAVFRVRGTTLHIMAVRYAQLSAAKLVQGPGLTQLLDWASSRFDWLVLDSPPVFPVSDVIELASHSDPIVMVVRAGSTRTILVRKAFEALGGGLKFVILNGSDLRPVGSYYYADYRAQLP